MPTRLTRKSSCDAEMASAARASLSFLARPESSTPTPKNRLAGEAQRGLAKFLQSF
jgi:hypothetical protein